MMTSFAKWVGLGAAFVLLGAACAKDPGAPKSSPVLASGEGIVVTEDELAARVREQPVPGDFTSPEKRRALLDQLIEHKALVAEAKRQGLERDPEIARSYELMLVQRLLRDRQASQAAAPAKSEADLRARYEAEKGQRTQPEQVRVSHLFLKAPAPSDRDQRRAEASALRGQAAAFSADAAGDHAFAELARKSSDEAATAAVGGDLTFRSREWLETTYSKGVADAVFALSSAGELSPVVESARGLHLFRFAARAPAREPTFEEFRALVAVQVTREARDEELRAYGRTLREAAKVVVYEAGLAKAGQGQAAARSAP
jgi:peptidyl-prolyl cis-trans isomerase C